MTYQKMEHGLTAPQNASEERESDQQKKNKHTELLHQEQINNTKKKLAQIKTHVLSLTDVYAKNLSIFSEAALYWNKVPLWQKIAAGVCLTLSFLIVGILAHATVLITLGLVSALVYSASSMLLDNHQEHTRHNTEQLKSGISNVTDLMALVTLSLDGLREQLAKDIKSFQTEIDRLNSSIGQLREYIDTLKDTILKLTQSEQMLRLTIVQLQQAINTLNNTIVQQSELLKQTQVELDRVIAEYNTVQKKLTEEINALNAVKEELAKELEQVNTLSKILNETVVSLSHVVIADEATRSAFHKRLEDFLNNKELSFDKIVARICEAEHQLALITRQFEQDNQRHKSLLDEQEQHLICLERIKGQRQSTSAARESGVIGKASINGFYAIKNEPLCDALPTHSPIQVAVI
ncbi:hypothetical protein [uncultured Legionella sp.]|uniref:hypothetical protein n=1 Tax=uncultured Legionella sp. TaxID=210934 RepID=UPI00261E2146|nr:hypothetical protein [uncultured Legionella sp.]